MRQQRRSRRITIGVVAVVVIGGLIAWSTLKDGDSSDSADPTATTTATTAATDADFAYGTGECAPDTTPAEPVIDYEDSFQDCIDPTKQYTAVFDTSEGEIRVALDTTDTPGTVNNFVNLARNGYYDGTEIFRTDPSIAIIQGGSPHTEDPSDPGPGYTISDEGSGFTYVPGQLVMARSSGADSASAQYFFVAGDAASGLDSQGNYVVFGETDADGLAVVESILALHEADPQSALGGGPSRTVTVNSVTIEETAGADGPDTTATTDTTVRDTTVRDTTTSAP